MMKIVGCFLNENVSTFLITTTSMLYLLQGIQCRVEKGNTVCTHYTVKYPVEKQDLGEDV